MCIFCKIINKEIPSSVIYEDEVVLAILDISQATKGHTLVLTKKHYENILDIDNTAYLKVMAKVQDLAKAITKAFHAKGCNILNNCGEAAGQSVMHFHVHIIPRYEENDVNIGFIDHSNSYDLNLIKEEISKELKK